MNASLGDTVKAIMRRNRWFRQSSGATCRTFARVAATQELCASISEEVAVYAYALGNAPDALERVRLASLRALRRETVQDELMLFPQAERDDLLYGLQTIVEGAMGYSTARAETNLPFVTL